MFDLIYVTMLEQQIIIKTKRFKLKLTGAKVVSVFLAPSIQAARAVASHSYVVGRSSL